MSRTPPFSELFEREKPVIAMAHLPPLPGTPLYDEASGVAGIVEAVRADLEILLAAGVDAVLFCNEGDRPYGLQAGSEGVAVLTRVVTELAPRDRPYGVDFLWDAGAALAVAAATGASFIREVTTGVYESDMGLWNTDAAGLLRERRRLGAEDVRVLMNVTPELASPLGRRSVADVARSAVISSLADAILVSGPMQGVEPSTDTVREATDAVAGAVPVLLNTGAKSTNVREYLELVDGVIVGSDLKVDGHTWNPVEAERVVRFMAAARG
jgi:membrane complex biogenesis BtpA family protein